MLSQLNLKFKWATADLQGLQSNPELEGLKSQGDGEDFAAWQLQPEAKWRVVDPQHIETWLHRAVADDMGQLKHSHGWQKDFSCLRAHERASNPFQRCLHQALCQAVCPHVCLHFSLLFSCFFFFSKNRCHFKSKSFYIYVCVYM